MSEHKVYICIYIIGITPYTSGKLWVNVAHLRYTPCGWRQHLKRLDLQFPYHCAFVPSIKATRNLSSELQIRLAAVSFEGCLQSQAEI